jgi:cell division FtsZ-interacting protein ZapD
MFKLIKIDNLHFGVKEDQTIAVGTKAEALSYLREILGVDQSEIDAVLKEFDERNTNVADFGISGSYTYTTRDESVAEIIKLRKAA